MNWSGKLYQIYEERWWNTLFATTMFFEIKALRLRHPLYVGQRALITNWYQEVEALRTHFESFDHWWEFQKTVCDDIGDYLLIGRTPPRDRCVFRGGAGIGLKAYAESFPGYRKYS
ncbi:MAG: hypothetical protein C0519_01035 [Hyphomicrobium sp.]|nr:hypothetical protein [Hyphomicrobium sp.]